jgi:hypothetical protein
MRDGCNQCMSMDCSVSRLSNMGAASLSDLLRIQQIIHFEGDALSLLWSSQDSSSLPN